MKSSYVGDNFTRYVFNMIKSNGCTYTLHISGPSGCWDCLFTTDRLPFLDLGTCIIGSNLLLTLKSSQVSDRCW